MFTGIVSEVGTVRTLRRESARARLGVAAPRLPGEVEIGDSVAVDGVCLTVVAIRPGELEFDVVTETLGKSTLGDLAPGAAVNLEGALRVGDRLSGHFVMGHVDGVGEVVERRDEPGQTVLRFRAPPPVAGYLLEKGSIAVSGVSLTIWDVRDAEFSVAVVPHTLAATTLSSARRGSRVNLEADVIARWVSRLLPGRDEGGLTLEKLRRAGWET
jgi:riboflavin synthase